MHSLGCWQCTLWGCRRSTIWGCQRCTLWGFWRCTLWCSQRCTLWGVDVALSGAVDEALSEAFNDELSGAVDDSLSGARLAAQEKGRSIILVREIDSLRINLSDERRQRVGGNNGSWELSELIKVFKRKNYRYILTCYHMALLESEKQCPDHKATFHRKLAPFQVHGHEKFSFGADNYCTNADNSHVLWFLYFIQMVTLCNFKNCYSEYTNSIQ